jgi:putative chitobiose transport system substrate-binding protein
MSARTVTRRDALRIGFGLGGIALLAACNNQPTDQVPTSTVSSSGAPAAAPSPSAARASGAPGTAVGSATTVTQPGTTGYPAPTPASAAYPATGAYPAGSPAAAAPAGGGATGYEWTSVGARSAQSGDTKLDFGDRKVPVSKSGAAQLEFWTINLKGPYGTWIDSFLNDYQSVNQQQKIKWVDVPGAETAQKYLAALGANQAPDLANTYEMPRFIEVGALDDIAQQLPKQDQGDFYPSLWKALTLDGKTYGFPWYTGTNSTVFSRKILQDAGLDPNKPPTTWNDTMTMSKTIKDKTGKYGLLQTVGQGELVEVLQQEGVPLVSDDRKNAALNTPDAVQVFKKWQDFYTGGYLPPDGTTANPRDANQWFYAGRGAIVTGGPVVIVKRADPAVLTQWDADVAGSIRGKNGKSIASLQYLIVSNKSKNVQAAVDLGAYVTGPGLQVEFVTQVPILPTRQSVSNDPAFKSKFLDKKPTGRSQQELLDRGFQLQLAELPDSLVDFNAAPTVVGWARMYDLFKQETNKLFATGQAPDVTLANIEKGWNDILAGK